MEAESLANCSNEYSRLHSQCCHLNAPAVQAGDTLVAHDIFHHPQSRRAHPRTLAGKLQSNLRQVYGVDL